MNRLYETPNMWPVFNFSLRQLSLVHRYLSYTRYKTHFKFYIGCRDTYELRKICECVCIAAELTSYRYTSSTDLHMTSNLKSYEMTIVRFQSEIYQFTTSSKQICTFHNIFGSPKYSRSEQF